VQVINQTAVATGTQTQVARYRGQDCSGVFTCTLVAVRRDGLWRIVNLQIGQPPARESATWSMFRAGSGARLPAGARRERRLTTTNHPDGGEPFMTTSDRLRRQPEQPRVPPLPDPALKLLDRFVGTWDMKGRTLDSDVDHVIGRTTFEWLPGGYFLQQRVQINFDGFEVEGLEVIGYDIAGGRAEAAG
jgi:hypothetical protein